VRVPQSAGTKGSLRWIQELLAQSPSPIEVAVRTELQIDPNAVVEWRSPRADDQHAEYRDGDFLVKLGLDRLSNDLEEFWPTRGPQWDALAVASDGKVILVEAKAHVAELRSDCTAGEQSRVKINASLDAAKQHFGAEKSTDWTTGYYQYANRLAHLMFLRQRGIDAHLVFIYFLNDRDVRGPASATGWADAIDDCHVTLGLPSHSEIPGLHSVFVDAVSPGTVV
jgi:hypothetical protein